jgi:hypothetical protein
VSSIGLLKSAGRDAGEGGVKPPHSKARRGEHGPGFPGLKFEPTSFRF